MRKWYVDGQPHRRDSHVTPFSLMYSKGERRRPSAIPHSFCRSLCRRRVVARCFDLVRGRLLHRHQTYQPAILYSRTSSCQHSCHSHQRQRCQAIFRSRHLHIAPRSRRSCHQCHPAAGYNRSHQWQLVSTILPSACAPVTRHAFESDTNDDAGSTFGLKTIKTSIGTVPRTERSSPLERAAPVSSFELPRSRCRAQ